MSFGLYEEDSPLNLYLVTRTDECPYDEFAGFVVACYGEDYARNLCAGHPGDPLVTVDDPKARWRGWTPGGVVVKLIGRAAEGMAPGYVLGDFRAG